MSEAFEAGCLDSTILEHSFLRMNQLRSQSHVAQQSRRDKLRVQHNPSSPQAGTQTDTAAFSNYILHQAPHSVITTGGQQTKGSDSSRGYPGHSTQANIGDEMPMYDAHMIPSEMFNFPTGAELLAVPPKGIILQQASNDDGSERPSVIGTASYPSSGHLKSNVNPNLGSWKSLNTQPNSDWSLKYIQGLPNASASAYGGQNTIAAPLVVAGGMQSGVVKEGTASPSLHAQADAMQLYLMNPGYAGYPESQSSASMHPPNDIANQGQETHKHFVEVPLHFPTFQQNAIPMVAEVSSGGSQGLCIAQLPSNPRESTQNPWPSGGNELVLLPSYGNTQNGQYVSSRFNNTMSWTNRQGGSLPNAQWSQEPFVEGKVGDGYRAEQLSVGRDRSGQGLSLSLSSHQPSEMQLQQFEARFGSSEMANRASFLQAATDGKAKSEELFNRQGTNSLGYFSSYPRDVIPGKGYGNPIQGVGGGSAMELHMNVGPLGPFTGYASVLKNSKYLKPAQQLLDEFCNVGRGLQSNMAKQKLSKPHGWVERSSSVKSESGGKIGNLCAASSSTNYTSADTTNESAMEHSIYSGDRFEIQRRKSKLLSMLEELLKIALVNFCYTWVSSVDGIVEFLVYRRYRHYGEQMQMVVTSFESIAGLGAATPYTALALKAMSRHFRCLRDAISNQLRVTSKALGEDPSVPGTSRGETPRLRFLDQNLRQQRAVQHLGMLEQHAWRPQRGLPERSVSVLRAWLFEHFLHPYPTDADKHMLARQTGLSRSQVSNWFINARVRLWKPMVEEMYLQETKESSETDLTPVKRKENETREKTGSPLGDEKNMNKHGKMMLDGGGSDKQSASECEGSKLDHGGSTSQTAQESSGGMSMPLESQFRPGEHVDGLREPEANAGINVIRESDSVSSVNPATIVIDRKLEESHACQSFDQGTKRFRNEDRIRFQGIDNTVDFSSYNHNAGMGGRYSHEDLTPRQIGSAGVSLTLGLRHSGGQEKYNNGVFLSREDSAPESSHHYNIHESQEGYGSGFDPQNMHFRKHIGNQLLHDFVDRNSNEVRVATFSFPSRFVLNKSKESSSHGHGHCKLKDGRTCSQAINCFPVEKYSEISSNAGFAYSVKDCD
eukprot:Gb_39741 [translate_table: standard]